MHFSELKIYKISIKLAEEIESQAKKINNYWRINEYSQIIRSSSSISANIAEGYAKRIYQKELIRFLNISLGSSDETQSHIIMLYKKKYIDKMEYEYFLNQYKNLSIKLLNFIKVIINDLEK